MRGFVARKLGDRCGQPFPQAVFAACEPRSAGTIRGSSTASAELSHHERGTWLPCQPPVVCTGAGHSEALGLETSAFARLVVLCALFLTDIYGVAQEIS